MSTPDSSVPGNPSEAPIGKYIAIEGPDGCGKTTAIGIIKELFLAKGKDFEEVNILKSSPNTLALRQILTNPATVMHPRTELAYYIAAVLNSLTQVVQPILHTGKTVISDRGPDSSLVYQCMSLGDKDKSMMSMHQAAFSGLEADLTIYLEPKDVQEGLDRAEARDGTLDRIEQRGSSYQQSVLQNYRMVAQAHAYGGRKVAIISNDGSIDELKEKLEKALTQFGYL